MDCSGSGNIKKRIKIQLDENHERKDHNKCQDEGEKRPCGDPFLMPLLLLPKLEEWCLDASIVLTGTACGGVTGPPLGAFDIGVSKTAYYFCIALPGVNKAAGEFSCEICRVGKVCIRGVASTGGSTVSKYPRVFVMKVQQQCPPGPFKLFFTLPGPVDPRLFTGCFRPDGVFEGIVAKYEQ